MFRKLVDLFMRPRYRVIVIPKHNASELRGCVLNGKPVPRDCSIVIHRRAPFVGWDVDTTEHFDSVDEAVRSIQARHTKRKCIVKVLYMVSGAKGTKC